jgi:flagellar basal body rod protein FlgG
VDPEGYLVDSEGYYLLDTKGEMIKLTNSQLTKLKDVGVFCKK